MFYCFGRFGRFGGFGGEVADVDDSGLEFWVMELCEIFRVRNPKILRKSGSDRIAK